MWKRGREKEVCHLSGFACSPRMDKWYNNNPPPKKGKEKRGQEMTERESKLQTLW